MYLFDRSGDNINIYTMDPIVNRIKEYQKREMEQIPFEHRILRIETNSKNLPFDKEFSLQPNSRPIDIENKELTFSNKKIIGTEYHKLGITPGAPNDLDFVEEKIKGYYFGNYNASQIVRVYKFEEAKKRINFVLYLLLNSYYIKESENSKVQSIENIINIPESLYLLELLKREQYSLLDNKDITEQLNLFKISEKPVKTYSLYDLEEIGKFGFDPYASAKALHKVEESRSIFERVRRKK